MLKWTLVLLGLATALVLGPFVVGMFLPKEHIVGSSVTLLQPPDSVWIVLRDLGGYPSWWQDIKRSERDAGIDDREVWIQTDSQGQEIPLEVIRSIPPNSLVTRIADNRLPFSGQWTFDIQRYGMGSRVTVTEEGKVFNPVFRLVARFFIGYYGTVDRCLEALGRRFGEQVAATHVR